MAGKQSASKDFSQIGYLIVTETGANTLTFNGLSVFSNVLGQKGMILHRAEYVLRAEDLALLVAAADELVFGMAGDDGLSSVTVSNPEVYDMNRVTFQLRGTAANASFITNPVVKDWNNMPGGGLLVPADRLYAFCQGVSVASAIVVQVRIYFDIIDLNASDYLELAQAMRVLK